MKNKQAYLVSTEALSNLSKNEIEEVGQDTKMVRYHAGHLFYMPDDPAEVLFHLKRGTCAVVSCVV